MTLAAVTSQQVSTTAAQSTEATSEEKSAPNAESSKEQAKNAITSSFQKDDSSGKFRSIDSSTGKFNFERFKSRKEKRAERRNTPKGTVLRSVGSVANDTYRLATEIGAKLKGDGIPARMGSLPLPIASIPLPRRYKGYEIQDEKTRDALASLNSLDLALKTAYNNFPKEELTNRNFAQSPTVWKFPVLGDITGTAGLRDPNSPFMTSNSNEMIGWIFGNVDNMTHPIGAKFLMNHMMSFDGDGLAGRGVRSIAEKRGQWDSESLNALDHNVNRAVTALGASAYNVFSMSSLTGPLQLLAQADQAFAPTQAEIDMVRDLLGADAENMSDEELSTLVEYANRATSQDDKIAHLTELSLNGLSDESYDAESLLVQLASLGTEVNRMDAFTDMGYYFNTRAFTSGANAVLTSGLLANSSLVQLEGVSQPLAYGSAAAASGARFLVNQSLLAAQGKNFEREPGNVNPYFAAGEEGERNKINPTLTAINAASQFGTLPLAIIADQTEHPYHMTRAFSENLSQATNALYAPELHYMLNDYSDVNAPTTGGTSPALLYNALEGGVGSLAAGVYGYHQGELLREAVREDNFWYATPIILGAAAQTATLVNYRAQLKPTSEIVADAAKEEGLTAASRESIKDAGWVPLATTASWAVSAATGYIRGKLPSEEKGGGAKKRAVEFSGNGLSVNFSRLRKFAR